MEDVELTTRLEKLRRLKALKDADDSDSALSRGKRYVSDIARGGVNMLDMYLKGFQSLPNPLGVASTIGGAYARRAGAPSISEISQENLPISENESQEEKYARKAREGIGGAALMAPQAAAAAPIATMLAGAAGGAGGEAGRVFGEKTFPDVPVLQKGTELLGGLAGGISPTILGSAFKFVPGLSGVGKLIGGPSLTTGEQRVHDATKNISPEDLAQARKNLELFQRTGAQTATLADAVPGNTALASLADDVRGSHGGGELANRVAKRGDDVSGMTNKFLNNIGPEVDTNTIAANTVKAANKTLESLGKGNSQAYSEALKGQALSPGESLQLRGVLRSKARQMKNPDDAAALQEVITRLQDPRTGQAILDLPTLSIRLKGLKDSPPGPNASTGAVIDKKSYEMAVKQAEEILGQIKPVYKQANERFRNFRQNTIEPVEKGPLGRIADNNPFTAGVTPPGRLNQIFTEAPETIEDLLHQLSRAPLTQNNSVDPSAVVRAWAQNRIPKGSNNPGLALRGQEGSAMEEKIAAALTAAGKNPQTAMEPLQAADLLARNFRGPPGVRGATEQSPAAFALAPKFSSRIAANISGETRANEMISRLMAPTRENLDELLRLAKHDPNIRRQLVLAGILSPSLQEN